ncbi:MAG: GNAT family N-acetyltransferase [Pseudohongiellaceae bacterium]
MAGLTTHRLHVREVTLDDAEFIEKLTNEPGWLRFIGDKGIRSLEDAKAYIGGSMIASYQKNGYGIWLVETRGDSTSPAEPVGSCGLVNRDTLSGVDLGFAFLQKTEGCGYAYEAAQAVIKYAKKTVELSSLKAITLPDNERSINLLRRLLFEDKGPIQMAGADNTTIENLLLFERTL